MSIQTINPSTNKTEKSFEEMTEKTVGTKVVKAHMAFTNRKETIYPEQTDLIHKIAKIKRNEKSVLTKTSILEMGKIPALAEVEKSESYETLDRFLIQKNGEYQ